ncbi:universal stress protein [Streptomyces sp. ZYX-F-203]
MSTLPVIAAVDGSDDSLRALDWARDAARRRTAPLRVVHVRQYPGGGRPEILAVAPPETYADPVLEEARDRSARSSRGLAVEYVGMDGPASTVLPALGAGAGLLVLGSRGRGGFASLLLGSTSLAAARAAECPVVVVPRPSEEAPEESSPGPGPRVVVGLPTDGPDDAVLDFAFAEAAMLGAALHVVSAYPAPVQPWVAPGQMIPPMIDETVAEDETRALVDGFLSSHRAGRPDVRVEVHAAPGGAAGHLVAASRGAALVVVGRHRRRFLAPARMMGSVTQAVVLHAACPAAVVPLAPAEE